MARRDKSLRRIPQKGYLIIGDGETESWYFSKLKEHEKLTVRLTLSPPLPIKRSLSDISTEISEQLKHYDKVFWIVDLDVIIADQQIDRFIQVYNNLRQSSDQLYIYINNPCLEFWFLLHFEQTSRPFNRCDEVQRSLKKFPEIADYEKSERYYKNYRLDIWQRLKKRLEAAKSNAASLGFFDLNQPKKSLAEVWQIFSELLS